MKEDDPLIIMVDHGNDPTHTGTDHTREKVPFLAFSPSMRDNGKLEEAWNLLKSGVRDSSIK